MAISFNNSTNCSNSTIGLPVLIPNLRTKSQLNKIIVSTNGKPDHLAINLYWDTFRSWYNPNKTYTKDGNILSIKKLNTNGIYTNYQKLSELHGVSKDTIRKKIIKLEMLGLTNRSFQHKETITTKSFNQLVIYVWKNTPHFFNTLGIDKEEIISLNPYTSHNYVADKHNVIFASQAIQNKANLVQGGVIPQADTKELIKPFSREKDRSMKSNFLENSLEEGKIIQTTTQPSSDYIQEIRVVSTNQVKNVFAKGESKHKPQVFPKIFKAKELKDFYPLTREDCQKLQSNSGREFSLNSMNKILLDMSKRLTNRYFKSKKSFLSYMGKVFSYEMRDAVKINNDNFKIRNNKTENELTHQIQEKYLTAMEYSLEVSPEWHFKKRLAARLPQKTAYELLKAFDVIDIKAGIFNLCLLKYVELTDTDRKLILQEARATHEQLDFADERLGYIEDIKVIMPEKTTTLKHINQSKTKELSLPVGIWGRVRQRLISIYGVAVDRNWFSKLEVVEDVENGEIKLKAPNNFIRDWVNQNYFDIIEKLIVNERGFARKPITSLN